LGEDNNSFVSGHLQVDLSKCGDRCYLASRLRLLDLYLVNEEDPLFLLSRKPAQLSVSADSKRGCTSDCFIKVLRSRASRNEIKRYSWWGWSGIPAQYLATQLLCLPCRQTVFIQGPSWEFPGRTIEPYSLELLSQRIANEIHVLRNRNNCFPGASEIAVGNAQFKQTGRWAPIKNTYIYVYTEDG